tara:strand:- start:49 stop:318 length:270 start_codon:yes stop_codon:yes gene_type:complete
MQKLVNVIAVVSGVVSLTVVGTAGYVFVNKDAIIQSVTDKALGSLGGLGGALGGGGLGGDLPVGAPDLAAPSASPQAAAPAAGDVPFQF